MFSNSKWTQAEAPLSGGAFSPFMKKKALHGSSGFTLVEVMVYLAIVGLVAVAVLRDSTATMHKVAVDQMVRDISDLSRTIWKLRGVLPAIAVASTGGGKVIDQAFVHNPPVKPAINVYNHPLNGSTTVLSSSATSAVTVSIAGLAFADCSEILLRLDAQDWAIVRVSGTLSTVLKSNLVSPFRGDLSGNISALTGACSNAGNGRILVLERRYA